MPIRMVEDNIFVSPSSREKIPVSTFEKKIQDYYFLMPAKTPFGKISSQGKANLLLQQQFVNIYPFITKLPRSAAITLTQKYTVADYFTLYKKLFPSDDLPQDIFSMVNILFEKYKVFQTKEIKDSIYVAKALYGLTTDIKFRFLDKKCNTIAVESHGMYGMTAQVIQLDDCRLVGFGSLVKTLIANIAIANLINFLMKRADGSGKFFCNKTGGISYKNNSRLAEVVDVTEVTKQTLEKLIPGMNDRKTINLFTTLLNIRQKEIYGE